jgi:hypothetical protein
MAAAQKLSREVADFRAAPGLSLQPPAHQRRLWPIADKNRNEAGLVLLTALAMERKTF